MNKYSQNKIKAIKEDLDINVDDSLEDIAIRNNVDTWVVEFIEDGNDPNDKEEEERKCSFCGEPSDDFFCSRECRIAEYND